MKFNKAKGKVLHMGRGNLKHKDRLGDEWIESSPAEKDLGILVDGKLTMIAMCARSPEIQLCPGLHQEKCGQQIEGGDCPHLFCSGETPPHLQCWVQLWVHQHPKDMDLIKQVQRTPRG